MHHCKTNCASARSTLTPWRSRHKCSNSKKGKKRTPSLCRESEATHGHSLEGQTPSTSKNTSSKQAMIFFEHPQLFVYTPAVLAGGKPVTAATAGAEGGSNSSSTTAATKNPALYGQPRWACYDIKIQLQCHGLACHDWQTLTPERSCSSNRRSNIDGNSKSRVQYSNRW